MLLTMFTDKQIEQLGKVIDAKLEPLKSKLDTLELNVEILRSENKKAHTEIVENLAASNEINGKQIKELENRVTHLEPDSQLPQSH